MNEFFYNLFFILVPILVVGAPIILSVCVYYKIKRKGVKKAWFILAFIPIVLAVLLFLIPVNL